ncbi:alpha-N-arabinofuranosidase [Actinoplanes sp. NPDC024001]|uniref:arabinosylfuranosidase ArfA n=1 Tax=Actinoplanes sp. NPDC024001 TaxID=3154598 RepID=UPI0033D76260
MHHAALSIDPRLTVAEVDPRLFGSFVEHMGRCVYTGIHEPGHPTAGAEGFRDDVAELVRELGVPILRYPGGNFVSGYTWEDGIGPRDQRPRRLDLAWRSIETNQVGVDEFLRWTRAVGSEPMLAVNLGTRGVDAARALLEYCNHPSGTAWSDLRRANGSAEPYGVRVWCLGNEMDGPWQIGHKTATEYGRLAAETAKAMRRVDPTVELAACGSSNRRMPTFGAWEATVLAETYDQVDYISLHSYYEQHGGDRDSFLASAVDLDRFIEEVVATCDHVRAVGGHRKRIDLAVDEWNVWYQSRFPGEENLDWAEAPRLIEDTYSVADAVVVGNLLISLLRHADRVKIGCLAQLVNVIAPIRTEPGGPAWRQTIFYPFALTSRHGRGTVLRTAVRAPAYETAAYGRVPLLDTATVLDEPSGAVTVFAVNRDQREEVMLDVDLRACPALVGAGHVAVADPDAGAVNTAETPDRVVPHRRDDVKVTDGHAAVALPPLSWNMLTFRPSPR